MTLQEWLDAQPKLRTIDALDRVWRGWCMDDKCPNSINYRLRSGATLRIKPPKEDGR